MAAKKKTARARPIKKTQDSGADSGEAGAQKNREATGQTQSPEHGSVSLEEYLDLLGCLNAWDQATRNKENQWYGLSRRNVAVVRQALRDAVHFSTAAPEWIALKTRFERACLAMRNEKGRDALDAFGREMGVVQGGGRRQPDLSRDEAEQVVSKYCELTCTKSLATYVDDRMLWASGFREQVESRPSPPRIQPEFAPIQHPRPVVQAPVCPAEAVEIIAEWFRWRFAGNPQAVREFLEGERSRMKKERAALSESADPAERARVDTWPPSDFKIPGKITISRRQ